ncbi:hypothetical protein CVT24_002799 [Panaeolus cyanescens]|uniref:Uncharacterized protein n=1 Tax=Panaeolus cyanescens TaxID=181874 RepID=A0A409WCJ2_9AGAR|nr:hypothetical protein CVT24_002799 [Panaeolus cyanescens]
MFINLRFLILALSVVATPGMMLDIDDPMVDTGVDLCATQALVGDERARIEESIAAHRNKINAANCNTAFTPATIDVYFHIVAAGNDVRSGMLKDNHVNAQIDVLNESYKNASLTFHLMSIDRKINSTWFSKVDIKTPEEGDMVAALEYRFDDPDSVALKRHLVDHANSNKWQD